MHGEGGGAVAELGALAGAVGELRAFDPAAAAAVDPLAARLAAAFAGLPAPAGPRPEATAAGPRGPAGPFREGTAAVAGRPAGADAAGARAGDAAARFAAAGYLTRRVAERVGRVLAEPELPAGDIPGRRFLHRLGELWPTAAARLGAAATDPAARAEWRRRLAALAALAARAGAEVFDPPRLVGGEEVQALLGVGPGPRVGEALAALRAAQVDGRIRTREQALALLTSRSSAGSAP
jgi:poly(A) polymerase